MDVEARKKFCGLLMFDSPSTCQKSPTSQSFIDISSRGEVDPSAMGYYSQNNFIPMQDSHINDFNKSHALAAGAAAGDEPINDNNVGQSSTQSQPKRTPRPPNAFILYRRAKQPAIIASQRHLTNAEVSRQISDMWKSESEETRLEWERYADRKKLEHMKLYPDYVYRPVKNKKKSEKVDKRRQQRRKEAAAANESKSVGNEAVSTTGPVRRRSKPVPSSPTRLDLSSDRMPNFFPSTIITSNLTTRTDTAHPILPSQPEIPMMASPAPLDELHNTHFPDMSSIPSTNTTTSSTSSVSPITPISPPQLGVQSLKVNRQQNVFHELAYSTNGHNTPIQFQSIDGSYGGYQNLDYCVIPDVYRSHRQVLDDYMLHHNISTPTSPTDTSNIYVETGDQFYHTNGANGNGQPSYTDLLANLDVNDFLGGSANQQVAYLQ